MICRYGLPVNFQAILLHPHKKCARRLRDALNQLYAHLDSSATASTAHNQDVSKDIYNSYCSIIEIIKVNY